VGWDDLGRNNPHVDTPNIDRLIRRSTLFSNFYVTPQCAQSRAQLLTGRNFVRTGTLSVSGGTCLPSGRVPFSFNCTCFSKR
jgi:arylsulfatase A-like enzyme